MVSIVYFNESTVDFDGHGEYSGVGQGPFPLEGRTLFDSVLNHPTGKMGYSLYGTFGCFLTKILCIIISYSGPVN